MPAHFSRFSSASGNPVRGSLNSLDVPIDFFGLDDLVEMDRACLYKDLKTLTFTSNI